MIITGLLLVACAASFAVGWHLRRAYPAREHPGERATTPRRTTLTYYRASRGEAGFRVPRRWRPFENIETPPGPRHE